MTFQDIAFIVFMVVASGIGAHAIIWRFRKSKHLSK